MHIIPTPIWRVSFADRKEEVTIIKNLSHEHRLIYGTQTSSSSPSNAMLHFCLIDYFFLNDSGSVHQVACLTRTNSCSLTINCCSRDLISLSTSKLITQQKIVNQIVLVQIKVSTDNSVINEM